MESGNKKLAVLIDADNAQSSIIEGLLTEVAKYGTASVKRIYGDWTNPHLKGWKEVLLETAIQPIQQFSYTTGKNATDSALIIDAMDLLYTEKLDGFCIVSSDSDFTKLCSRIREAGLMVIGFGEEKTAKAFVNVCDKFIYTEILRDTSDEKPRKSRSAEDLQADRKLVYLIRNAVEGAADESGWAYLANVGQGIAKMAPEFDPRNYGFQKLGSLIKAMQLYDVDERTTAQGPGRNIYVRYKPRKRTR